MAYCILPASGIVISCTTVQRITNLENQIEDYTQRMNYLQINLEGKLTTTLSDILGQSLDGPRKNVLSLKDEYGEFVTNSKRVINH